MWKGRAESKTATSSGRAGGKRRGGAKSEEVEGAAEGLTEGLQYSPFAGPGQLARVRNSALFTLSSKKTGAAITCRNMMTPKTPPKVLHG